MASDIQDRISISTEENDDILIEPVYENVILLDQNDSSPVPQNPANTFPWIPEFTKLCQSEIGLTNIRSLEKLMTVYQKQVSQSVKDCYSRPNRAAKLKRLMGDTLLFFHMTYSDLKPPLEHSSYLAKMSDLMAMYLDMEIKASRTGTESLPKIASKLTSSLHVYFGRSQEHILDTVLKSKIISKNYWELSDLIFRRVLRESPGTPMYVFTYIRYILAFKMWKGIMMEGEERKKIAQLAEVKLKPPEGFREKMGAGLLRDILPRVPKSRSDFTTFFMQAKFPVRDKIKLFLKAVQDPKLQCALDRQTFKSIEAFPSGKDESESSALMNDIWSSMNIDSEIHDNFSRADKTRKMKHIAKLKAEHLKKRKKKTEEVADEIGEDDKPTFDEVVVEDDVNFIKVEVEDAPQKEEIESHNDIIQESENSMEIAAEVELSSHVPSEIDNSVKVEDTQLTNSKETSQPTVWPESELQTYYNSVNFDYLGDAPKASSEYVVVTEPSHTCATQQEIFEVLQTDQIEVVDVTGTEKVNTSIDMSSAAITASEDQHVTKEMITNETEVDKSLLKDLKMATEYNVEEDSIGVLHDYTIRSDSKMYEFQMKVFSYASKLTVRTWINLLSPLFCEQSRLKMYRCCCAGCKDNLSVLRRNWKHVMTVIMLNSEKGDQDAAKDENGYTYENSFEDLKAVAEGEKGDIMYWETEIENLLKKIDETVKEDSESSNLPLKKRKAFPYSNTASGGVAGSGGGGPPTAKDDKTEVSYPSTPMMSIAEFELDSHKFYSVGGVPITQENLIVPNYQPHFTSHHIYPSANSVLVQSVSKTVSDINILPESTIVPGAYTTTFLPVVNQEPELKPRRKVKFKTPAQLKEFQDLSAAQDVSSCANTSHTFGEHEGPTLRKQERRKKAQHQSRKRKRT